ncbi:MAG: DUF4914 family protein [Anaerolineae bacterium]
MKPDEIVTKVSLPEEVRNILLNARSVTLASSIKDLEDLSCGTRDNQQWEVSYELPDGGTVQEAHVVRVKNGISANYVDIYMRRRDPDCMVIADDLPSDKVRFQERFDRPFQELRQETFSWLAKQDIAVFAFNVGQLGLGGDGLAICPANAGFFAFGLGLLQGVVDIEKLHRTYNPSLILYIAPPFRHTHFDGKQVVVHNRSTDLHEIYSYNLYPGPSAKKGVYGALINKGVHENWVTAHCSVVQVVTPYDNMVTFMHEGASGGGKSEMLQQPNRLSDGRLLLGRNTVSGEKRYIENQHICDLHPVCDDMGLCHPTFQKGDRHLWLIDAESAWFVRVNHITAYGTDPNTEGLTIAPSQPLLFLNIDAVAGSTALIWDHIQDAPGKPCPNPRVIIPRSIVPNVVNKQTRIDIRSFGVRTPPCTKERPTYGILGLFHVLPASLAWLWRLVSPRGHKNPSVVQREGMSSEGVGAYWPFVTGRRVDQANLLLRQFTSATNLHYILTPNQHIGAWETNFMPQWLARDYLARREQTQYESGQSDQFIPSRCPLLGYSPQYMRFEGAEIPIWLLQVDTQPEVGIDAYDRGAEILAEFFHKQIKRFLVPDLDELGQKIIDYCLSGGDVAGYERFIVKTHE